MDDGTQEDYLHKHLSTSTLAIDGWPVQSPLKLSIKLSPGNKINQDTISQQSIQLYQVESSEHPRCLQYPMQRHKRCSLKIKKALNYIPLHLIDFTQPLEMSYEDSYTAYINEQGQIVVQPIYPLQPGKIYTLIITDALQDSSGNNLQEGSLYQTYKNNNVLMQQLEQEIYRHEEREIRYMVLFNTVSAQETFDIIMDFLYEDTIIQPGPYRVSLDGLEKLSFIDQSPILEPCLPQCQEDISPSLKHAVKSMNTFSRGGPLGSSFVSGLLKNTDLYESQLTMPSYIPTRINANTSCNEAESPKYELCNSAFDGHYWRGASTNIKSIISLFNQQKNQIDQENLINELNKQTDYLFDFNVLFNSDDASSKKKMQHQLTRWHLTHPRLTYQSQIIDQNQYILQDNPLPQIKSKLTTPVLITTPKGEMPAQGWPSVILIHGITSAKEDNLLLAQSYSEQGIATLSIDLPMHGTRGYQRHNDQKKRDIYDFTTTEAIQPYFNLLNFAHINDLRVTRDYFRQAVADILSLRLSITALEEDVMGRAMLGSLRFDKSNIGLQGYSLGAIVGEIVAAFSGYSINDSNPFAFQALVLVSPAVDLSHVMFHAEQFKKPLSSAVTNIIEKKPHHKPLSKKEINTFLRQFLDLAQVIAHGAEPSNSVYKLNESIKSQPLFIIEIEGDATVRNHYLSQNRGGSSFSIFSGTDPLLRILQLKPALVHEKAHGVSFPSQLKPTQSYYWKLSSTDEKKLSHTSLLDFNGYELKTGFSNISFLGQSMEIPTHLDVEYKETTSYLMQCNMVSFFSSHFQ